ncbi:MAG: RNA polymerase sporulation sigma factor SigH [Armatimonadetes bacterium]|nr:RNA polymerase sporulation sigma factor SigH [Armatimonadota bacterium]
MHGKEEEADLKPLRYLARPSYDGLTDQDIVKLAQAKDVRASEYLLYKYRGLVRAKARSYYLVGGDRDDLLQIGMIGLWQSIIDYSPEKHIPFVSFARICIERHIITAIKAATRQKQAPLNNAVSLDYFAEDPDSDFDLSDVLISDAELDPEELIIRREEARQKRQTLRRMLSGFEWKVLNLYNCGQSYWEIAQKLVCNVKSVDNALGRIKRKILHSQPAIAKSLQ